MIALRNVLTMPDERIYSLDEAAGWLGVHRNTLRKWILSGELVASRPGKEYRIRQSDLDELLRRKQIKPKKDESQEA